MLILLDLTVLAYPNIKEIDDFLGHATEETFKGSNSGRQI